MKKITTLLVILLAGITLYGQDIVGTWEGSFDAGDQGTLRVVFHIKATDDGYTSTADSPDQDAFDIATTSTTFKEKELVITIDDLDFIYTGKMSDAKTIKGSFTQMGGYMEMDLIKKEE